MIKVLNYLLKHLRRFNTLIVYYNEIQKIKNFLNSKAKTLYFVFDLSCTPLRIGNFIVTVALTRFFLLKGKKVKYYVINNKLLKTYARLNKNKKEEYLSNFKKIIKIFLKNEVKIELIKFNNLDFIYKQKDIFLIFKKFVFNRERLDIYCAYLTNYLVKSESKNFLKKYLINKNDFKSFLSKKLNRQTKKDYKSLQIRFDKTFSQNRNITFEKLISVVSFIFNKEKCKKLLIVSDKEGCDFAKKALKNHKNFNKILFSRDYGDDITSDALLMFCSKKNFNTHFSGGIQILLAYSRVPFENYAYLSPTTRYIYQDTVNQEKYFDWQSKNQKVYNFFGGKHQQIKKKLYSTKNH